MPLGIRTEKLTKVFPGVTALDRVSIELAGGRVHAIVGENGAGKSTFARILGGLLLADEGKVWIQGALVQQRTPHAVQTSHSVALVPQELQVCRELSIAENVWLGNEPRRVLGFPSYRAMRSETKKILAELGEELDPERAVGTLSVAGQQLVLIARAIARQAKLLILDEPTSVLAPRDVRRLIALLRRLADEGVTIIYVSHRLREIFELADEVHVLRDGRHISSSPTTETTEQRVIAEMVGRELKSVRGEPLRVTASTEVPLLAVENVSAEGVRDISFEMRPGEIFGVAGLPGSGRTELLEVLFGVRRRQDGAVRLGGEEINLRGPREAIRRGVGYVPGERLRQAVIAELSVAQNIALTRLHAISKFGLISKRELERIGRHNVEKLRIRCRSVDQPLLTLSGGNQQKVVFARWLQQKPVLLLLDEPTRGIDVGAKAEIYGILRDLARGGVAIILSSSELPELLAQCDRIAVMANGRIQALLDHDEADEETVMRFAVKGAEVA